ncbi:MAG: phosphoribosyltransferase [Herminiimonas sp.]|nr:phosphoribosyltransferase [Herminiimonas sp.]
MGYNSPAWLLPRILSANATEQFICSDGNERHTHRVRVILVVMSTLFSDRLDAAEKLAGELADYAGRNPLVLAIPRGGVPMANDIARRLGGELDIILVRKIGVPFNPEYAMGAVAESGHAWMTSASRSLHLSEGEIALQKARQIEVLKGRRALYTPSRTPVDPRGRIVIIVDDGLATGATMTAALHAVREQHPAELICAVPVAASDSIAGVADIADRVVCPFIRDDFNSVGQYYRDFAQVDDAEVIAILAAQGRSPAAP